MEKKYGIFYNEQFNVFMVALKPSSEIDPIDNVDLVSNAITLLKKEGEIIGANVQLERQDLKPEMGFCSEEPTIVSYIEKSLRPWITLEQLPQFLIGKIISVHSIPQTHLRLCKVDINTDEPLSIICGAENARAGLISVVATTGSWLPNSQVITPKIMMGYATEGMLCSAQELHLRNHHYNQKGIIELPHLFYKSKVGTSFWREYYAQKTKFPF